MLYSLYTTTSTKLQSDLLIFNLLFYLCIYHHVKSKLSDRIPTNPSIIYLIITACNIWAQSHDRLIQKKDLKQWLQLCQLWKGRQVWTGWLRLEELSKLLPEGLAINPPYPSGFSRELRSSYHSYLALFYHSQGNVVVKILHYHSILRNYQN